MQTFSCNFIFPNGKRCERTVQYNERKDRGGGVWTVNPNLDKQTRYATLTCQDGHTSEYPVAVLGDDARPIEDNDNLLN